MQVDDRELARRFPSGDEEVVRAVYQRYGRAVHTIALSVLHDPTEAADVVQATFLNAWRAAARFKPGRELGPWLYSIARRQAIDAYRRNRRVEVADTDRSMSSTSRRRWSRRGRRGRSGWPSTSCRATSGRWCGWAGSTASATRRSPSGWASRSGRSSRAGTGPTAGWRHCCPISIPRTERAPAT